MKQTVEIRDKLLLSVKEAMAYSGFNVDIIRMLCARGLVDFVRIGKCHAVFIHRPSLEMATEKLAGERAELSSAEAKRVIAECRGLVISNE